MVYDKRPVIHFMNISNDTNWSDNDQLETACMNTILVHEITHTLGMDDVYDNPGHDVESDTLCVMERFDDATACEFYNKVQSGLLPAFCDSCMNTLRGYTNNILIEGNQEDR